MDFKIEKGVPIPPSHVSKGYSHALRKLKVGESVVLPAPANNLGATCRDVLGKGNYVSRTVEGGTRVWRLK